MYPNMKQRGKRWKEIKHTSGTHGQLKPSLYPWNWGPQRRREHGRTEKAFDQTTAEYTLTDPRSSMNPKSKEKHPIPISK